MSRAAATAGRSSATYAITSADPREINEVLAEARKHFILVAPAQECEGLADGYEIATSFVDVDVERETYDPRSKEEQREAGGGGARQWGKPVSGPCALKASALERIGRAAGIDWAYCVRVDDQRTLHYCRFEAVGRVRQFDGTWKNLEPRGKTIDLREGVAKVGPGMTEARLAQQRRDIVELTETKACLRVIRQLLPQVFDADELRQKPFLVARVLATGRVADPKLRAELTRMRFAAEFAPMGARRLLYGAQDVGTASTIPAPRELVAAPPVHEACIDQDDDTAPVPPRAKPVAPPAPPARAAAPVPPRSEPRARQPAPARQPEIAPRARSASPPPADRDREPALSGFEVPGGSEKGRSIEHASTATLEWWRDYLEAKLAKGTAKRGDDEFVQAMNDVLADRACRPQASEAPPRAESTYRARHREADLAATTPADDDVEPPH